MASSSREDPTVRRLEDKVALITGGAQGIGEAIARLFTKHGAKVIIVDILDDLGRIVCEDLGLEKATYVHCDVTTEADVENAINIAIMKYGKLDIMINNAAIIDPANPNILDNNTSSFEQVIKVNLTGVFIGIKNAARVMIPARKGSIINIGSICSSIGGAASHAYTSSKHAVIGLTKNVAAELGQYNIRVNCLSPYCVLTQLTKDFFKMDEEGASSVYSNLTGKYLTLEDVAEAAIFLGSDESKYVSGHNLALDGGYTVINPSFGIFSRAN